MKLGTRRSLLARAQSGWVAREIERMNPGTRVELVGIETRGDRILDVPLRQVEGKEFFVKELDDALLAGEVDLTVHSFKDLSLERPKGLTLAAIPKREDPRDVILFSRWSGEKPLKIGTSSPRRLENLPPFLADCLPGSPKVEWEEIRGNVNTRLARVHEPEGSERRLDGVVLAAAGLMRLWADKEARKELEPLLKGLRWILAPLDRSPTAPAQGALAVECRADNKAVLEKIRRIHDESSETAVRAERVLLEELGGGCHQRFGATVIEHSELGPLLRVKGKSSKDAVVDQVQWRTPVSPSGTVRPWNGLKARAAGTHKPLSLPVPAFAEGQAVFVAHWRALPESWIPALTKANARVWTSGDKSWRELAKRGVWVEGSAEGLGVATITELLVAPLLRLPPLFSWMILTHEGAADGWDGAWKGARVIPTYNVDSSEDAKAVEALKNATHAYWSSGSQYRRLKGSVPEGLHHSCGPGKTAEALRQAGVPSPEVFPDSETWEKWLCP